MSGAGYWNSLISGFIRTGGKKRYRPWNLRIGFNIERLGSIQMLTQLFYDDFNGSQLDYMRKLKDSNPEPTQAWTNYLDSDPNHTASESPVQYTNQLNDTYGIAKGADSQGASDGSALVINLKRKPGTTNQFVSSEFRTTQAFAPGPNETLRITVRAKMPSAEGGIPNASFPAIWLIPVHLPWPRNGEIDIVEYAGQHPNQIQGALHGPIRITDAESKPAYNATASASLPGDAPFSSEYHDFAIEWSQDRIDFLLDNVVYSTMTPSSIASQGLWEFDPPLNDPHKLFNIVINLNQGGGFGGPLTGNEAYPQSLFVDFVSVESIPRATNPTVSEIYPSAGPLSGGTPILITGSNFTTSSTVTFGNVPASSVTFVSSTEIRAVAPPASTSGISSIVVTTPNGSSLARSFNYGGGTIDYFSMASSFTTNLDHFVISGTLPAAAQTVSITVNGVTTPLTAGFGSDREFSTAVQLQTGSNDVSASIRDLNGTLLLSSSKTIQLDKSFSTFGTSLVYVDAVDPPMNPNVAVQVRSPLNGTVVIDPVANVILGLIPGKHVRGVSADGQRLYMSDNSIFSTATDQDTLDRLGFNLGSSGEIAANAFVVSPTGDRVYYQNQIYDVATRQRLTNLSLPFDITTGSTWTTASNGVSRIPGGPAISADGKMIVGGSPLRAINTITMASTPLNLPTDFFLSDLAFSPDGQWLVVSKFGQGNPNGEARVFDTQTFSLKQTVSLGDFSGQIRFLTDKIAVVGAAGNAFNGGGNLTVFDVTTGQTLSQTASNLADNVAISAGHDKVYASSGNSFGIDVWDVFGSGVLFKSKSFNLGINNSTPADGIPGYDEIDHLFARGPISLTSPITVVSINRSVPTQPLTNASSVTYVITFSDNVMGVDADDFELQTSGVIVSGPIAVTGSGNTYQVTVSGITGDGSLQLKLKAQFSIQSLSGQNLEPTGNAGFTGQTYTFDHTGPSVSILPNGGFSTDNPIVFQIQFSETVNNFILSDVIVANGTAVNLTTSDSRNFQLSVIPVANAVVSIRVNANVAQDVVGNGNTLATASVTSVVLSNPKATITAVSPDPRTTGVDSIAITFDKDVTGFDLTDLSLTRNGGANLLVASTAVLQGSGQNFTLTNLAGLTAQAGDYQLTLNATGSSIVDQSSMPFIASVSTFWQCLSIPTVILSLNRSSMPETGGSATVTATLSSVTNVPVTVNLAFSGTANFPSDYSQSGTQIVIPAGSLSGTMLLTSVADTAVETTETIVAEISSVTNGVKGGTQQVTLQIIDDDNHAPVFISNANPSVTENSTAVINVNALDTDFPTQAVTYSLSGGDDQRFFVINTSTGQLSFLVAPDFESPQDLNQDNRYGVTVRASDPFGAAAEQNLLVTVNDVNENPGPKLSLSGGAATWSRKQSPVRFLSQINVESPSSLFLGTLRIQVNVKINADQFKRPSFASIGTLVTGRTSGNAILNLKLSANATAANIQSFLRNLTFSTKGAGLRTAERTVTVTLTDASGRSSQVNQTIHVLK